MENKKTLRPFGMRDKIGYALGDLGCGLSFSLVSNYMFLFYAQIIGLESDVRLHVKAPRPMHDLIANWIF